MEKQFKKIHGQQFFFVSVIALFYLCIFLFVFSLIDAFPANSICNLILLFLPAFAIIGIIIFAVSRLWAKPYATLAENYMIVDGEKIFYFDIEKIEFIPGSWLGSGRHSSPYGPARVHLYCKDKRYTRFSDEDFVTIEGISYHFFLSLKEKCPSATVRYKYFVAIFLIVPLCIALTAVVLGYISEEYLE